MFQRELLLPQCHCYWSALSLQNALQCIFCPWSGCKYSEVQILVIIFISLVHKIYCLKLLYQTKKFFSSELVKSFKQSLSLVHWSSVRSVWFWVVVIFSQDQVGDRITKHYFYYVLPVFILCWDWNLDFQILGSYLALDKSTIVCRQSQKLSKTGRKTQTKITLLIVQRLLWHFT